MVLLFPFLWAYSLASAGFVIAQLWEWHVTPVVHIGAPRWQHIASAIAIFYVARGYRFQQGGADGEKTSPWEVAISLLLPWFALGIGWAVK